MLRLGGISSADEVAMTDRSTREEIEQYYTYLSYDDVKRTYLLATTTRRHLPSGRRHKTLLLRARPSSRPLPFLSGSIIDLSYLPGNQMAMFDQFIFHSPPILFSPCPAILALSKGAARSWHWGTLQDHFPYPSPILLILT